MKTCRYQKCSCSEFLLRSSQAWDWSWKVPEGDSGGRGRAEPHFTSLLPSLLVVAAGADVTQEEVGQWSDDAVSQAKGACEEQDSALCSPKAREQRAESSIKQQAGQQEASSSQQTLTTCPLSFLPLPPAPGSSFLCWKLSRDPHLQKEAYAPLVKVRSLGLLISHQSHCWSASLPAPRASCPRPSAPLPGEQPSWATLYFPGPNSHNLFSASMKLSVSLENQNSESDTQCQKLLEGLQHRRPRGWFQGPPSVNRSGIQPLLQT